MIFCISFSLQIGLFITLQAEIEASFPSVLEVTVQKAVNQLQRIETKQVCDLSGVKGTFSDHKFQTSLFFKTPGFFLHLQIELHCNKLPKQQVSGNSIFLERERIFYRWELILAGKNTFKPVFLVINHLDLLFS